MNYLQSIERLFRYYKQLGEQAIEQIEAEQLFLSPNEESNSIAVIIQHLHGNMLSRWTNFLTEDGEKEWRNRDAEFENHIHDKTLLMQRWGEGWACLLDTIGSLTEADLDTIIYIRNEGHSVSDAINRQLAHYPYHVGQIVYIARMWKQEGWKSLSIPKNKSKDFNAEKFAREKQVKHFTEEMLKKPS